MKEILRKHILLVFLLAASAACLLYAVWELYLKPAEPVGCVERDAAGGAEKKVELEAVVEGEGPLKVELEIPAARFTDAEAEEYFNAAAAQLNALFSSEENTAVKHDLTLPEAFPDNPVRIEWQSSRPWILSSDGKIRTPDAEGEKVTLTAVLTLEDREEKFITHLTVFPPEDDRGTAAALAKEAEKLNEGSTDGSYYLPSELAGREVSWYGTAGSRAGTLAVILLLTVLILVVRERKQAEERLKKRNEALKEAYPELISMVLLLSCAGLAIRKIMYRIALMSGPSGKEDRKEAYGHAPGYGAAFEEIGRVCADLDRGIGEPEAYERLGTRCAGAGYRTFAMLLARSTVRGSAGLQAELEQEAQSAFEDARRRAKAAGDMAAVKLLLPMALMLAVVMIIVLVPSFLSFMQ